MAGSRIKLDKDLLERCKLYAEERGYSSVEEFISHALEKELMNRPKKVTQTEEEIKRQLKGLGYID